MNRDSLKKCCRVVVKLGTGLLTYPSGKLNLDYMDQIVRQLADLHNRGIKVVLVSSGAVGAGLGRLGIRTRPKTTAEKQAVAAIGQGLLIQLYEKLFSEYGILNAQVLLTRADLMARHRYLNACNTLDQLLKYGAIPIINENDTVAVEEIEFGDNDTLSAQVAALVDADLLLILSDVAGLYTANPQTDENACMIPEVAEVTGEIRRLAGESSDPRGTGGMITKVNAAEIASACGIPMVIASGREERVVHRVLDGEMVGTLFSPSNKPLTGRKRWIAFARPGQGVVFVDSGAAKAISEQDKSLLPSGVTRVEGKFSRGEMVTVVDNKGNEIVRGLVNFSSQEVEKIMGRHSRDITAALGYPGSEEIIHRDNMVYVGGRSG